MRVPVIEQEELPECVVGLYSFPRSGNTWLRQIIASALDIPGNMLHRFVPGMRHGQVVTNPIVHGDRRLYFYKSHHEFEKSDDSKVLMQYRGRTINTDKVVYIYRHPLDVFISFVNYASKNVKPNVNLRMGFAFTNIESLTPEQLGVLFSRFITYGTITQERGGDGYFEHVSNAFALRDSGAAVHIMRYEDLLNNFASTAGKMFDFLEIPVADIQAVFGEADKRTAQDGKFFWKRQSKAHLQFLTAEQIETFNKTFRDKLIAFGYPPD